mmetsp:Transcript_57710/g.135452  ORF Transcript_57710/g.135452 Transcript_57710/m.135452 type:complete len:624 (-) Transcript_57710:224-2095(-)
MPLRRHRLEGGAGEALGDADDGFQLAHRDRDRRLAALAVLLAVALPDADVLVLEASGGALGEAWRAAVPREAHEPAEGFEGDFALLRLRACSAAVQAHHVPGDALVTLGVTHVADDEDQVEARQDRALEVDVLDGGLHVVVAAEGGVGGGEHGGARVEHCCDPSLGHTDGLLLHRLVDRHLVLDVHLIELIDAADPVVCQHERACLDAKLPGLLVLDHRRRQPCGGGGLARGVDSARHEARDVLEELRLCARRVAHYADVDVAPEVGLRLGLLVNPAEEHEQQALLDLIVSEDSGAHAGHEALVQVGRLGHAQDLLDSLVVHVRNVGLLAIIAHLSSAVLHVGHVDRAREERHLVRELAHSQGAQPGDALLCKAVASARLAHRLGALAWRGELRDVGDDDERAGEDDFVSGLRAVHHLMAHDHVERARHRARRDLMRVFLNAHALEVDELRLVDVQVPVTAVGAGRVLADDGLGVLELLLGGLLLSVAVGALEVREDKLGAHFGGARDGARDAAQAADAVCLEVAQLDLLRQVVERQVVLVERRLVISCAGSRIEDALRKRGRRSPQHRLDPVVVELDAVSEIRVVFPQVHEVDLKRGAVLGLHVSAQNLVVLLILVGGTNSA